MLPLKRYDSKEAAMKKLYLITGFLGAGKTTLMRNMIRLFSHAAIIVNEFGKESIDGPALKEEHLWVDEISNGSIFCVCRSDQFVAALARSLESDADVILVETSGLSDPTGIDKILDTVENVHGASFDFCGTITLVDAPRFLKLLHTAVAVRQQILGAGLILINKSDLADTEHMAAIRSAIKDINETADIHEIRYGQIQPQWLENMPRPAINGEIVKRTIGTQSFLLEVPHGLAEKVFLSWLDSFAKDCYRIKGFVCLDSGWKQINAVGEQIEMMPWKEEKKSSLVILAPGTVSVKKNIFKNGGTDYKYPIWL